MAPPQRLAQTKASVQSRLMRSRTAAARTCIAESRIEHFGSSRLYFRKPRQDRTRLADSMTLAD